MLSVVGFTHTQNLHAYNHQKTVNTYQSIFAEILIGHASFHEEFTNCAANPLPHLYRRSRGYIDGIDDEKMIYCCCSVRTRELSGSLAPQLLITTFFMRVFPATLNGAALMRKRCRSTMTTTSLPVASRSTKRKQTNIPLETEKRGEGGGSILITAIWKKFGVVPKVCR